MAHLNAYEPTWQFERSREVYELLPVPEILWPWWYWCACRVRGQVIKVETLGGATYEKARLSRARPHLRSRSAAVDHRKVARRHHPPPAR